MPATPKSSLVPINARQHAQLQAIDRAPRAINAFEKLLGGRGAFVSALATDDDPGIQTLVGLLQDEAWDTHSLGSMAAKAGLTLSGLLKAFRRATLAKAQIHATTIIAGRLPAVVEDVMIRAAPHEATCQACDGLGTNSIDALKDGDPPKVITCLACRGRGMRERLPDLDRQKLALELGEMIKPKGALVQIQNTQTLSAGGSLEHLQQAVSGLLYGATPTPLQIDDGGGEILAGELMQEPEGQEPQIPDRSLE